jgi:hypothetical protein
MAFGKLRELELLPPSWLVEPWLQTLRVAIMYGDSQAGKTWLAFLWATQLAAEGLRVLLVEGEGSLGETRERLQLIAKGLGVDQAVLGDRVFVWQDSGLDLREHDDVEQLCHQAEGFDFVLVDTVSAHAPGSDEAAQEMSLVMHGLRRVRMRAQTTVLALHHVTKAAAQVGKANMSNASGHSNMKRLADTMLEVIGKESKDGRIRFSIEVTKQRGARRAEATSGELRIDVEGAVFTWDEKPIHRGPVFTDREVTDFVAALPGPTEKPIGLDALGKRLKRRPADLRRLTKVAQDAGLAERLLGGKERGIRRAAMDSATTHPRPVPQPSRPGAPGGGGHPSRPPVPSLLYGDGSDGCSPGVTVGVRDGGPPVPELLDGGALR